ncbi:P-loop NTPase family protein [Halopelagius longus]|nr:hypothetical protein [Halopelagius longus]RDI72658.1 hypothetical protein DWB78_13520 [Halopelagius longus]
MTRRTIPELPTLDTGVTLLEMEDRASGALHSLVLDHILLESGSAVWIDSRGNGTTQPMAELAPSMRVLNRVHIARAFTPWQHYSLIDDIPAELPDDVELVVLPDVDAFYRADDLGSQEADQMLTAALRRVVRLAVDYDLPVLVTRTTDDAFSEPVADVSTTVLQCEQTAFGPRFSGDEFETLVYPVEDGLVQTTFAFWRRVLSSRHAVFDEIETPAPMEVQIGGPN